MHRSQAKATAKTSTLPSIDGTQQAARHAPKLAWLTCASLVATTYPVVGSCALPSGWQRCLTVSAYSGRR